MEYSQTFFLNPALPLCLHVSVTGISFVPKEIGEHLVNIKKNGRHIPNSPISVMISQSEIGDASRVRVSGQGLSEARTFEPAEFVIDTRDAGTLLKKMYDTRLLPSVIQKYCFLPLSCFIARLWRSEPVY